jgi:hypothetical protein
MARDHGRILASIWTDPEFLALPAGAQRLYLFLTTQADLSYAGAVALRLRRWARSAADLTVEQLAEDLGVLAAARFVVVDEDTEEVLVRTLIRNDGIWKQPNVMKAAAKDAREILSPTLRASLAAELERLPLDELSDVPGRAGAASARDAVSDIVTTLLGTLTGTLPGGVPETLPGTPPARVPHSPTPLPIPVEDPSSAPAGADDQDDDEPTRPDVDALCRHLADRIEANGSKRPTITKRWRTSARLLLDVDGRTTDQVRAAIDWCQDDEFWRSNILSMPKLREKYDQLRLKALEQQQSRGPAAGPRPSTTDQRVAEGLALAERFRGAETPTPDRPAIGA